MEPPFALLDSSPLANKTGSGSTTVMRWEEAQLYSNLWTGITPALVHHNAHRDNMKHIRETMWDKLWFQSRARELLSARLKTREVRAEQQVGRQSENPSGVQQFMVRTDKEGEDWIDWNSLCDADMQQEVFRDGKGMFGSE